VLVCSLYDYFYMYITNGWHPTNTMLHWRNYITVTLHTHTVTRQPDSDGDVGLSL